MYTDANDRPPRPKLPYKLKVLAAVLGIIAALVGIVAGLVEISTVDARPSSPARQDTIFVKPPRDTTVVVLPPGFDNLYSDTKESETETSPPTDTSSTGTGDPSPDPSSGTAGVSSVKRARDVLDTIRRQCDDQYGSAGTVSARRRDSTLQITASAVAGRNGRPGLDLKVTHFGVAEWRVEASRHAAYVRCLFKNGLQAFLTRIARERDVRIDVYGRADGIPVRSGATFSRGFGPSGQSAANILYWSMTEEKFKSVVFRAGQTPLTNERIALLRAYDLFRHTVDHDRFPEPNFHATTTDKRGPQYRGAWLEVRIRRADGDGPLLPAPAQPLKGG